MSVQPLLEGQIETAEMSDIRNLQRRVDSLESELKQQKEQVRAIVAMASFLKRQLSPVFSGKQDETIPAPTESKGNSVSAAWKAKLGGKKAQAIEVLELGPKTRPQLRAALLCGWSTIDAILKSLRDMGVIQKQGNEFSLKN